MKHYQSGGPVPAPGKVPGEGGRKSRLRDLISEEERRELDAPLRPEDFQRPAPKMKKGGMVKPRYGSPEHIVGHGKTPALAKADYAQQMKDYAQKMKSVGLKPKGMASGGVTRADGCAARGKTKGRMI